jgi:hypothetical protein
MVVVVQSVRTSDCGSEGRGFESHHPPLKNVLKIFRAFFFQFLLFEDVIADAIMKLKAPANSGAFLFFLINNLIVSFLFLSNANYRNHTFRWTKYPNGN